MTKSTTKVVDLETRRTRTTPKSQNSHDVKNQAGGTVKDGVVDGWDRAFAGPPLAGGATISAICRGEELRVVAIPHPPRHTDAANGSTGLLVCDETLPAGVQATDRTGPVGITCPTPTHAAALLRGHLERRWDQWFHRLSTEPGDPVTVAEVLEEGPGPFDEVIDLATRHGLSIRVREQDLEYQVALLYTTDHDWLYYGELVELENGNERYEGPGALFTRYERLEEAERYLRKDVAGYLTMLPLGAR